MEFAETHSIRGTLSCAERPGESLSCTGKSEDRLIDEDSLRVLSDIRCPDHCKSFQCRLLYEKNNSVMATKHSDCLCVGLNSQLCVDFVGYVAYRTF